MEDFLLGDFLVWLPIIFNWGIFFLAGYKYFFLYIKRNNELSPAYTPSFSLFIKSTMAFRVGYALLLTLGQYYVWSQNNFTRSFLNTPLSDNFPVPFVQHFSFIFHSQLGYFFLSSWGRFWLNAVLSLFVAWVFYLFLTMLKKYRGRFFDEGETELGFVCALCVGWPYITLFVPIVFFSVIIISLFRMIIFRAHYTTLGIPFLFATLLTLIFGEKLLKIFHLSVLTLG